MCFFQQLTYVKNWHVWELLGVTAADIHENLQWLSSLTFIQRSPPVAGVWPNEPLSPSSIAFRILKPALKWTYSTSSLFLSPSKLRPWLFSLSFPQAPASMIIRIYRGWTKKKDKNEGKNCFSFIRWRIGISGRIFFIFKHFFTTLCSGSLKKSIFPCFYYGFFR